MLGVRIGKGGKATTHGIGPVHFNAGCSATISAKRSIWMIEVLHYFSVVHSEVPKWYDDAVSCLYIIFYYSSVLHVLYLLLSFFASANLKGVIPDGEVRRFGRR